MSSALRVAFALLLVSAFSSVPASAKRGQTINSVTIIAAGTEASSMSVAADLADALDEGDELRILPLAGRGPVQSLADLFAIQGIDAAIVPADAFAYAQRQGLLGKTAKKVRYVAKLGTGDIHILARAGTASLTELKGQKVDVGLTTEERFSSAGLVFDVLGIDIEPSPGPQALSIERLKRGEIAATVLYGRKPLPEIAALREADGLTLLAVPLQADLARIYAPQIFDSNDYPDLIGEKAMIEGLSVSTVLAVSDWPKGSAGHNKIKTLTTNLYGSTELLHEGARRAPWSDVNLAASVPGWTRYAPAESWTKDTAVPVAAPKVKEQELKGRFTTFVAAAGVAKKDGEEALFARFLEWQKTQVRE
jgi:TRAP-type uncharacterized transport system substrate-binding protein